MQQCLMEPKVLGKPKLQVQKKLPSQILRETKLQQGFHILYEDGKFCALGVIAHELGGWEPHEVHSFGESWTDNEEEGYEIVRKMVGQRITNLIWHYNDSGASFKQIAYLIEGVGF